MVYRYGVTCLKIARSRQETGVEMSKKGITEFLMEHTGRSPVSFHMPGHKGSRLHRECGHGEFLDHMVDCDITEIPGADNLFQAEDIIRETAEKYRNLYGVKKSYLLINGTSGGLIAGILASVQQGGKLVMARNCHKSVFNALTLGSIDPVYAYPSVVEEYGISGPVEAAEIERCLSENPDASAVILPSPNYYGICSDIEAIAGVVHGHGKILIVDQAHGAHLKFMKEQPPAAEECGADIVVNSVHKTLASFTQSAVLNVASDRVDLNVLEDKLQAIQSTSPSYLLMASLDMNADIIEKHGDRLFSQWQQNLDWFYREARKISGLRLMKMESRMDHTKINLDMSTYGIDGNTLEELLMKKGIFIELVTGNILMCMTGIGNTRRDFERLLQTLEEIAETTEIAEIIDAAEADSTAEKAGSTTTDNRIWTKKRSLHGIPDKKQRLNIDECAGKICASSLIPYPPGIPLLCPGEKIDSEDIAYVKMLRARGEKVIGINEQNEILVGE